MNCMFSCFQGKSEAVVRTEKLKSCTEDLNINLHSPRLTININDAFLYVGVRGGEVEQTTFHYENHAIY